MSNVKRWLKKALKIIVIAELCYVVVINALLQIPLTQTVINQIRPEKFHITWDNAWSWYPARVHVRGASANGNSRGQIWQFEATSASGSIALLPLIFKRVRVSDVAATDIDFRMRPRLKPDKDYSRVEAFFPAIEGREVTPAVTTPRKKKRPWTISVEGIHVSGQHSYWIYQFQGGTVGEIRANLDYRSRGGPLALDVYDLSLDLDTHYLNGDEQLFRDGRITGSMGFAPFMPRENKGLPMLDYLLLDLDVRIDANRLEFIRLFAPGLEGFDVSGSGLVEGRLRLQEGFVQSGTDLTVNARDLRVRVFGHGIRGSGTVGLAMGPEHGNALDLAFLFHGLRVVHEQDEQPLLTGQNLELRMGGDGRLVPDPEKVNPSRVIRLAIDGLRVPDLALFQRYLPEKWPFRLHGGDGTLGGTVELRPTSFEVDLRLVSDEADMGIRQYRFLTNLDTALRLVNPSIMTGGTRVDGSYLALSDAYLLKEGQKGDTPWSASLVLKDGEFSLLGARAKAGDTDLKDLFRILGDAEARELLGSSGGVIEFTAEVSSLAWIGAFLNDEFNARFDGSSTVEGVLHLAAGLPEPGTDIEVRSSALAVRILDYISTGEGLIALKVTEGGEAPDWHMKVAVSEADLRRPSDSRAYIQDVELQMEALVEDVTFDREKGRRFALTFRIPSARVTDMSVFNAYLPPDAPLRITGGEADLGADILLRHDDADGLIRLKANGIEAVADQQALVADLGVDIALVDGVPAEMAFDITGSRVVLDQVQVAGDMDSFDGEAWSAVLELTRGHTVFTDPPELDIEAGLSISDSRPLVALFRNQEGWRPEFIARMLLLEDISGTVELHMADDRLAIPEAWVTSDNVDVGMKALITPERRDGMIYLKYKKFDTLLKIRDGKRNLDLINVKEKYDEYRVTK